MFVEGDDDERWVYWVFFFPFFVSLEKGEMGRWGSFCERVHCPLRWERGGRGSWTLFGVGDFLWEVLKAKVVRVEGRPLDGNAALGRRVPSDNSAMEV